MAWQDYFWPGTEVLRNKLDLRDSELLDTAEHQLAQARQIQIERGEAGIQQSFDATHIRALHAWLFQDVYPWGGHYRTVNIAKSSRFATIDQIETCVNNAAAIVADVSWGAVDDEEFCDRAAAIYGWINFAHPFREGNGRTARLFMSAIAQLSNRSLNFGAIRRDAFLQRAAFSCPDLDQSEPDYTWMVPVFEQIMRPAHDLSIITEAWSQQQASYYDRER